MCSAAALVCFVACHGGPADHFATFANDLKTKGHNVHIYASGPALAKFRERAIEVNSSFELENKSDEERELLADEIAKACAVFSVVLTDIAAPFEVSLHRALSEYAPKTKRLAYYDNPERYVPGGYSSNAALVMQKAQGILFANARYETEPVYKTEGEVLNLSQKSSVGIGYYPVDAAKELAKERSQLDCNKSERTIIYLGGNNEEYFKEAFPAFLRIIEMASKIKDLSLYTVFVQQHPGAKSQNRDGEVLKEWKSKHPALQVEISTSPTNEVLPFADIVAYYQTSMSPQLGLAGIPTMQVGHKVYPDLLVQQQLCPVVLNGEEYIQVINAVEQKQESGQEQILQALGVADDWAIRLEKALYVDVSPCI